MTIYEALGTIKSEDETWQNVFDRLNATRGIDHKTLIKVIIYILEQLDDKKETYSFTTGDPITDEGAYTGDYATGTTSTGTEKTSDSGRAKKTTKKV